MVFKSVYELIWNEEDLIHDTNKEHNYHPNIEFKGCDKECYDEIILETLNLEELRSLYEEVYTFK
jgi:hypothetical protein